MAISTNLSMTTNNYFPLAGNSTGSPLSTNWTTANLIQSNQSMMTTSASLPKGIGTNTSLSRILASAGSSLESKSSNKSWFSLFLSLFNAQSTAALASIRVQKLVLPLKNFSAEEGDPCINIKKTEKGTVLQNGCSFSLKVDVKSCNDDSTHLVRVKRRRQVLLASCSSSSTVSAQKKIKSVPPAGNGEPCLTVVDSVQNKGGKKLQNGCDSRISIDIAFCGTGGATVVKVNGGEEVQLPFCIVPPDMSQKELDDCILTAQETLTSPNGLYFANFCNESISLTPTEECLQLAEKAFKKGGRKIYVQIQNSPNGNSGGYDHYVPVKCGKPNLLFTGKFR